MKTYICVVDNGFVYVGRVEVKNIEGVDFYVILNGFNVRRSGTTQGFGEIALKGPLAETELDPCPPVLVPMNRMCHMITCTEANWVAKVPVV